MKSGISLVYGFGINDADYPTSRSEKVNGKYVKVWKCPFYQTWVSMLERCFSERFLSMYPTYEGCCCSEEWRRFSKFKSWMENEKWEGNHIDKDFIGNGKLYSPETCVFIPPFVNTCALSPRSTLTELPLGVSISHGKFLSTSRDRRVSDKAVRIGRFETKEEAHKAWQIFKRKSLEKVLVDYSEMSCYIKAVGDSIESKMEKLTFEMDNHLETKFI